MVRLRPATPLSVLLLAAFALLLVSVLSVPITQLIPLGKFKNVSFGVFGYCKDDGSCSPIGIGYDTEKLLDNENQAFDLPTSVRDSVSAILVVHPVAALLTLIMFVMAAASHLHGPGHSARYILVLFILILITFLVTLLAFLVDVLLFIPHLAFGSYMVLTATILVALSGIVSCAMRRTLVSRKARQKRIAENAEMSGENYHNREGMSKPSPGLYAEPTMPVVTGGKAASVDALPVFASYEQSRRDPRTSDERIPLTQRSPTDKSPNAVHGEPVYAGDMAALNAARQGHQLERFGNAPAGPGPYAVPRGVNDRNQAAGGGGYRGRGGGYGLGGRPGGPGSPGPYGAPGGRGGYGPPGRGAGGPRGGRGYGPPPRGAYRPRGGGRPPPPPTYNYDARPPPDAYFGDAQPAAPPQPQPQPGWGSSNNNAGYKPYNPGVNHLPRAESPPPLPGGPDARAMDPAMEKDAVPAAEARGGYGQYGAPLGDRDADVAGMVGLQQGRPPGRHDTVLSDGSRYSTDDVYVPPRVAWNENGGRNSPRAASPAGSRHGQPAPPTNAPQNNNNYYEDVDPRFATPARPNNLVPPPLETEYDGVRGGGARSPAESEKSNFTSISQRGVNPRWNPNPPPMPGPPRRLVQQQRQDMLLDNPDFQLPGGRARGANRGGPGMIPGSAYPAGAL